MLEGAIARNAAPVGLVGALLVSTAALLLALLLVQRAQRAYCNYRRMRKAVAGMPGSPTLPLLGNVLEIMAGGNDFVYDNLCRIAARYGPTLQLWLGPELLVAVMDPRDVELVCTSPELVDKSPFYRVIKPLLGDGLVCIDGKAHRRHRKIVTPSLHLDILREFLGTFQREAVRFADELERHADDGEVFDVVPLCVDYAQATGLQTIMTTERERGMSKFNDVLKGVMEAFMYRIWHPWFQSDSLFRLSGRREEYFRIMSTLNSFTDRVIAHKRSQLTARKKDADAGATEPPRRPRRRAFLDTFLENEEAAGVGAATLTDQELREETKTLLLAASETTAGTLSFVLMVLSLRQDVQDRLVQELDDVLGENASRPVTAEELPHLQYLERVIKETLRMFPTIPFFVRHCPRDVQLPSGYTAPRGSHLAVFLPTMHNDPKTWPEPRRFDPDRFLPERSSGRHPFSYLPFSAGIRNCIGQRYAMLLLKVEVATLLRRFRFLPPADAPYREPADVPVKVYLSIAVSDGVRVRVQRRHQAHRGPL